MNKLLATNCFLFSGKRTVLYDFHVKNKGKMVQFAGYDMPVQYPQGIIKEHLHCREKASIFDVSHMGQLEISGKDRLKLLERTTVGSTKRHRINNINEAYLTLFLNENGGIIDDAIVSINNQTVRVVCNAGNKMTVLHHFISVSKSQFYDVKIDLQEGLGLIALQGPEAANVLQSIVDGFDLSQVPFMSSFEVSIKGQHYKVSRSGYTGEDGFEISGNETQTIQLVETLMKDQRVQLAGLGARDSLRLQAGLCLHGHEMSPLITPFEAGLMWTVHKREKNDDRIQFIGEQSLRKRVEDNKERVLKDRKRVGFVLNESGIVREQCRIYNQKEQQIGISTSGTFSPSLKKCVGMAYVDPGYLKAQTQVLAQVRGRKLKASIAKMPVVPSRYYKGWKSFI